jgi:hypothetical protein
MQDKTKGAGVTGFSPAPPKSKKNATLNSPSAGSAAASALATALDPHSLWTEKYRPQKSSQVIGQQGISRILLLLFFFYHDINDDSPSHCHVVGKTCGLSKLKTWLGNWHASRARTDKPAMGKASDTGWEKRAALLSGTPGIGKTTIAHIACRECGYDVRPWRARVHSYQEILIISQIIEFNASDTRNKKSLEEHLQILIGNTTMTQFYGEKSLRNMVMRQHCMSTPSLTPSAGDCHGRSRWYGWKRGSWRSWRTQHVPFRLHKSVRLVSDCMCMLTQTDQEDQDAHHLHRKRS